MRYIKIHTARSDKDPTWVLCHKISSMSSHIQNFTTISSFLSNFQLLGHLLVVAKNVAKQESLNEGYRVGKLLDLFNK